MFLLLLLTALPQQEGERKAADAVPPAQDETTMTWEQMESHAEEGVVVYEFKRLRIDMGDALLKADRAELWLDRDRYHQSLQADGAPPQPSVHRRGPVLAEGWTEQLLTRLGLPEDQEGLAQRLILDGNVVLWNSETLVRAQHLDYNAETGTTLIREADVFLARGQGPNGWPMRLKARELREDPDHSIHAFDASMTTCDREDPHYEVRISEISGTPTGSDGWTWSPSGGGLALGGIELLPIPTPDFSTGESYIGLTDIRVLSDNRYGQGIEMGIGSNFRMLEDSLNFAWNIYPAYSSRRGFPLRAETFLSSDNFLGEWQLFYLNDNARDVTPYAAQVGRNNDNRWRVRMDNTFLFKDGWRLDLDLAVTSDPLVDPEFFIPDWYSNDDARTEAYLRRSGDNSFFETRVVHRLDDVTPTPIEGYALPGGPAPQTLDQLPSVGYRQFSSSLLTLPMPLLGGADDEADLNFGWSAQAARLRLRNQNLDPAPGRAPFSLRPEFFRNRVATSAEITLPLSAGPLFIRPGAKVRGNWYSADMYGDSSVWRGTAEGFVDVGTLLVKNWETGWEHRVMPIVTFKARGDAGTPQEDLVIFDQLDVLQGGQAIQLGLRQLYIAPDSTEPWLDFEINLPYYPDPSSPLYDPIFPTPRTRIPTGSNWGPMELQVIWTPSTYGKSLDGVRAELRWRQDLSSGELEELFATLTASPHPGLRYGLGLRKVNHLFSVGDVFVEYRVSDEWGFTYVQPYTFTGGGTRAMLLSGRYYGHDFVVEAGFSRDVSSGNQGFFFSIAPRFLVDDAPARGGIPRPGF